MVTGRLALRFEDIAMDGRVRLEPLAASLGIVWQEELVHHPLYPWARDQLIIPITTRFVLEGHDGPFGVEAGLAVRGGWEVTRTVDAAGATNRFLLTLRTDLEAPLGRTNLPPPDDAGAVRAAGSVVAEHVFTRPFAEADQRRVTELGEFGTTAAIVEWADPRALLTLPAGARPLGPLERDGLEHVFALAHTDSNQHVNSLIYPRLFEEALVRRTGRGELLSRFLDVRYRKPSFPGDRAVIWLQPYEREGRVGAVGSFTEPGAEAPSGRVFLRMELA